MNKNEKPEENKKEETKYSNELEEAEAKLKEQKEKVKELKNKYTVKGCKVAVNKIYNDLYDKKELTEQEKINKFWEQVTKLSKEYVGEKQ